MNLSELKTAVDKAVERSEMYEEPADEIEVSLQIDGPETESTFSSKEVELHYDNNLQASGCVLTAVITERLKGLRMGTRENKVETYFKDQIKILGGISRKWVSPGVDGVPDQIVILNTGVFFVEIKTSNGTLSTAQIREHKRLRENGATVCTVYGHIGVDKLIDDVKIFDRPLTKFYG